MHLDFQWDEPFNVGAVKTDYNIYLFDKDGNWLDPNTAPKSLIRRTTTRKPDQALELAEMVPARPDFVGGANVTDYQIVVGSVNGGPARHIKYIVTTLSQWVSGRTLHRRSDFRRRPVRSGSRNVLRDSAIPEDFSASGPGDDLLRPAKAAAADTRDTLHAQITAADGVNTTFFFPAMIRTAMASELLRHQCCRTRTLRP